MLTEILIKPYLDDLERQGIEDTDAHVEGFQAGMAALSSILSEHVDNKAQLFVYLGMAISEGMSWVEGKQIKRDNINPIFAEPQERQPTPSSDLESDPQVEWDYIPTHDDLPASLIKKYTKKNVWFTTPDNPGPEKPGRAILDLSSNRLQIIETNGNQVKRPYYIQLR